MSGRERIGIGGRFMQEYADKWFESINAIAGLWLIYFWQDFYYKHFQKTASVSTLATSEDFIVIWEAFLKKYPSEGQYLWPSELILQDK